MKGDSTDGDGEVTWALGATLPPTRPAPALQLLHAMPEWRRAKESKKGMWTMTCPCEFEVCIVFYPVFAQTSRHCAAHSQMLQIRSGMHIHEFRAKLARISHEYLHYFITFHSQEQWHCWLPDPRAAMHAHKRFRPAGHTDAPARSGIVIHVTFDVPSSSAGATPARAQGAIPADPPASPAPDPVVVANPVAGTGATAYRADLPPITFLSMLRS